MNLEIEWHVPVHFPEVLDLLLLSDWHSGNIRSSQFLILVRTILYDSVGFLWELQFPPTLHYKSLNIFYRANNIQTDHVLVVHTA
jgi:hypothetical protein